MYDGSGNAISGVMNPDFIRWCREKNLDSNEEGIRQLYGYPSDVRILERTRDPRAIPLLKKCLGATNPGVVARCAEGLALLQQSDSIPSIVQACERFPKGAVLVVAESLAGFIAPEARRAFERFIPDPNLRAGLVSRMQKILQEYSRKQLARLPQPTRQE
jgi:HEAT repeat protein